MEHPDFGMDRRNIFPSPSLGDSLARRDHGYTLVELLTVLFVIAVLAAVAIPSFLRNQDRGHLAKNQQVLRNGLTLVRGATAAKADTSPVTPEQLYAEDVQGAYKDDGDPATPGHQAIEPPDNVGPGEGIDPTRFWLSDGGPVHQAPTGTEIVLCSLSEGSWISCVYDNQDDGLTVYRSFSSEQTPNKRITLSDLNGNGIALEPCDIPSRATILREVPCN